MTAAGPTADRPGDPVSLSDDTGRSAGRRPGSTPTYVLDVVTRALEEDLDGGVDVTSVATVPFDQESTADFVARADGVVAGLPVAAAVFEVATDDAVEISGRSRTATGCAGGDVLMSLTAATRGLLTGERTALNLLCRLSGIATLTRALGRRGRGHRGGGPRHPQDHARPARAGEVRRALRRRRQPPDVAVGRGAGQGQPRGRRGRRGRGLPGGAGGVPGRAGRGRGRHRRRRGRRRSRRAPTWCCSTTCRSPTCAGPSQLVAGRARLEASGGLSLDNAREVAETGVDYLAVGALTHSAPILDIACDLREGQA